MKPVKHQPSVVTFLLLVMESGALYGTHEARQKVVASGGNDPLGG
jgi:hypothetical protein